MTPQDRVRVLHKIDAAEEAISFIANVSETEFTRNKMATQTVIKEIEIIGETAAKISTETKNYYNNIPWQDILGMRNRLVHGYFDTDVKLVWNTVKHNLPSLISSMQKIIVE